MMATGPRAGSRKWQGSGIIRFARKVSPWRDSGFVSPWAWVRSAKETVARRTGETSVGVGYGQSVACFVLPGLEMHGFAGADAQQDAQDFEICDLLGKRGVQTGSSHFDESKVKACGESNRLEMGGDAFGVIAAEAATVCVRIRSGDGGVLLHIQAWHGLNKWPTGIKIRVSDAAIPRPEAGVDGQLHEVGEALFPGGTGGRASRNRGKVAQVHHP